MAQERSELDNSGLNRPEEEFSDDLAPGSADDVLSLDDAEHVDDDVPAEAEHIKEQIEETRSQLGETIDAIQEKLSFSNLSDQVSEHVNTAVETAKAAVYEATLGKAATIMKNISNELSRTSIVTTAKNNPFPFILIGLGAGLLAYQTYSSKGASSAGRKRQLSSGQGDASQSLGVGAAREKLSGITSSVSSAAGSAYSSVTDAVGTAYSGAGEAVTQAYGKVGEIGSTARQQYDHYLEENPLAVGAVAVALGAAVGMALPVSNYESRLMGPARQQLMEKAQTTASTLLDRTKEFASEAGKNVAEQARTITDA